MEKNNNLYVIITTFNRPQKLYNLLKSLNVQRFEYERVIIINGGENVDFIVSEFLNTMNVECHECSPPGQIRQRNFGISLLDETVGYVATLDDDIIIQPDAINNIMGFIHSRHDNPAAVSFNIINNPKHRYSFIKKLFSLSCTEEGRVLKTGYTTAFGNIDYDKKIDWAYGGATVWRKDILKSVPHPEFQSKWAYCEDLIFSYPIGKKWPLYVCHNAKVIHDDHINFSKNDPLAFYKGKNSFLWRLHFVCSNSDLSKSLYIFSQIINIPIKIIISAMTFSKFRLKYSIGMLFGFYIGVLCCVKNKKISDLISDI